MPRGVLLTSFRESVTDSSEDFTYGNRTDGPGAELSETAIGDLDPFPIDLGVRSAGQVAFWASTALV